MMDQREENDTADKRISGLVPAARRASWSSPIMEPTLSGRRASWSGHGVADSLRPTDALHASHCDTSLLPIAQKTYDSTDGWRGWTAVADSQGSLFYYHTITKQSVWQPPEDLDAVLGKWEKVEDQSGLYWHNAVLQTSVWRDPSTVTNVFQAAMDNNLAFLQLFADVGGDLNTADVKLRSPLHYACASGSREACQLLITSGATLDISDMNKATPLLFASRLR